MNDNQLQLKEWMTHPASQPLVYISVWLFGSGDAINQTNSKPFLFYFVIEGLILNCGNWLLADLVSHHYVPELVCQYLLSSIFV